MMPPSRKLIPFVLGLSLAGCAAKETPILPITEDGALRAFRPIPNSATAPCQMQRAVAAHNSVYDTLKAKKAVYYRAPCDSDGKGGASAKVAANAS